MADFPSGPGLTVGQLFTSGWSTWMWDGVKWMASVPSGGVYEPVFGGTQYPMYGFLYNKTVGDPGYSAWAGFGAHRWRFGISPGDDFSAGSIDYRGYASDALNIVGAGTASGNRKINLFDNVNVTGNLTVVGTSVLDGITNTGAINSVGSLTIAGAISSTGSTAILTFQDRAGTTNWGWYAQGGIARLWNDQSGDRVTFDSGGSISTPGFIRTGSNILMGGSTLYFSGVTAGGPYVSADSTNMTTQLGTGNGAFKWYSNPGVELMTLASSGPLQVNSEIHSSGSVASLWFQDRGGAFSWAWYADSNVARLYNTYGGTGRVVANVDVNGQASFAQGVYGAAFAINGTGHYIYDALSGHLGFRAGGAAGPYGYASLGADSSWTCGDIHAGNIYAPNFLINDGSAATAGTVGFLSGNGPGLQFWGNTSGGAGSVIFLNGSGGLLIKSDSVGNFTTAGTINVGSGVIELGQGRGGDGYAYVDFHAQAGTDYDFRIIRNPGANGGASIVQNGSAPLTFAAPNFSFNTAAGTGNALLEIYGTSGWDSLRVRAPNGNFIVFKPETGAGWCQIGYYVAGNWGTIEIPGNLQVDSVFYAAGISSGSNINMGGNYLTFQNSPANLGSSGPMLYGDSNWIVAKPGSGNQGFMLYDNAGQMRATIGAGGNILLTGNGNSGQVRMANSNTGAGYGSFWRNDSTSTYLLLTAVNDAFGQWNTLRPFTVDNASGNVTLGHRVDVGGGLYANAGIAVTGGFTSNGGSTFNGAVTVNGQIFMPLDNWLWLGGYASLLQSSDGNFYIGDGAARPTRLRGTTVSIDQPVYFNGYTRVQPGAGDSFRVYSPSSGHARLWHEVTGIRVWSQGAINNGWWYLADESAGAVRLSIDTVGNGSFPGQLVIGDIISNGNLNCHGTFYLGGLTMWNSGGWFYTTAGVQGSSIYSQGDMWCAGSISSPNNIHATGGGCMLQFDDRTDGFTWGWYATASVVRLWDSGYGDRLTIDRGGSLTANGNVRANGSIGANGIWFGNNGGWWWTGSPIHTDSDFQVNSVYAVYNYFLNGLQVYNNGGAWYFANQINCNDIISRGNLNSAGVLYVNGLMIQNYTGWWWTGSPIHTDSEMQCSAITVGGHRISDSGGWEYHDAGIHAGELYSRDNVWCAGSINSGNQLNCPNACTAGYLHSTSDVNANGWFGSGIGNGGAQVRCWAGDWGAMSYAISNQYFEISPDQGQSGFYYAPAGNWSDARLKLNIRESEIDALAVLVAIPIRAYEWTEEGRGLMPRNGSSVACGIVAQELEELIPSAVDIVPVSGGLAGGGMRRIIGDQFDAYYIRAIQQLLARIEELENLVLNPPERNLA